MSTKKSCALPKSVFPLKFEVKSPSYALELAQQLIRPFSHWVQDDFAVDKDGAGVPEKSARAEAFCALGALRRVNTKHAKKATKFLAQAALIAEYGNPDQGQLKSADDLDITGFNDDTLLPPKQKHKLVLKMFTTAIRLARKWEASRAGH